jgi:hypothetical protein
MQEVEDAVGENDAPPLRAPPGSGRVPVENLAAGIERGQSDL